MNEPSDGIAEEVERQLQLALAAAAIAARRATAARQHQVEQANRHSTQAAQTVRAQIDAERRLAAAHVEPVFDPGWWETATPRDVTDMWQQANSWRDPDRDPATPTVFDHAATRISKEVSDRTGLDPTQILALATLQELEHEDQTTSADPVHQPGETEQKNVTCRRQVALMTPSAASSSASGWWPPTFPRPRSRRALSPTSARAKSPPKPRAPRWRPRPSRGVPGTATPASNYSDDGDLT